MILLLPGCPLCWDLCGGGSSKVSPVDPLDTADTAGQPSLYSAEGLADTVATASDIGTGKPGFLVATGSAVYGWDHAPESVGEDPAEGAAWSQPLADTVALASYGDVLAGAGSGSLVIFDSAGPRLVVAFYSGPLPGDSGRFDLGDVSGDGAPDLLSGFTSAPGTAGFGAVDGSLTGMADAAAVIGYVSGANTAPYLANLGDRNGDGIDDVGVGRLDVRAAIFDGPLPMGASFEDADWSEDSIDTTAVAGNADLDGDGLTDAIFADAFADPDDRGNAGAAYVFTASGLLATLVGPGSGAAGEETNAGGSLGRPSDLNGDGFVDIIVGNPEGSSEAVGQGAWVALGPFAGAVELDAGARVTWGYLAHGGSYVGAVDLDADGFSEVLVGEEGAYTEHNGRRGSMAVFPGAELLGG